MTVIITGCGRSGTRYTSKLLQMCGLRIGHELWGGDGLCSWYIGSKLDRFKDCTIIHQVRNPVDTISSLMTFKPQSWKYISWFTKTPLKADYEYKAMRYYLEWNRMVQKHAHHRFRVEDIDAQFPRLCKWCGIEPNWDALRSLRRDVNTRKESRRYHTIGWDYMYSRRPALADKIRKLARSYGYKNA